ncbi:MAG: cell division protein FtsW [Buchnera aphidicola (Chaetogeoica yunlongensis)]
MYKNFQTKLYDIKLLWVTICLILIGTTMIISSSISIAEHIYHDIFIFVKKQSLYLIILLFLFKIFLNIPISFWKKNNKIILFFSIITLLLVLIFGHSINGASRWITINYSISMQPSELAKLSIFFYLSDYLSRKHSEIISNFWGFYKPIIIISLISILLLAEPDLGSVTIILLTTISILFILGTKIWKFLFIVLMFLITFISLIIHTPYRIKRIISFLHPWEDPFGKGYQLTQSLMALGRGNVFGTGLGNSIQKLEYLPEAYTDFILSIIGEELGYIGICIILSMLFFVSFRAIQIGKKSLKYKNMFSGYLAISIGLWLIFQTLINVGTTIGLLPTKGLTLPLISYGGSSLIIASISIMILLRIDFESRITQIQAFQKNNI